MDLLLAPLSVDERPVFLALLGKLTQALNGTARVPLVGRSRAVGSPEHGRPLRKTRP